MRSGLLIRLAGRSASASRGAPLPNCAISALRTCESQQRGELRTTLVTLTGCHDIDVFIGGSLQTIQARRLDAAIAWITVSVILVSAPPWAM